jgi:hypothetical protein
MSEHNTHKGNGMNINGIAWVSVAALLLLGCTTYESKNTSTQPIERIAGIWHLVTDTPQGQFEGTMFIVHTDKEISGKIESNVGDVTYAGSVDATACSSHIPWGMARIVSFTRER